VWALLVDPVRLPEWEAGLVAVEDVRGRLDEPGASCVQVMNFRRTTLHGRVEVTEAYPPRTRTVHSEPPLTRGALRRERLIETDRGTQLTFELSWDIRGGPIGALLNVALTRPRLAIMIGESLRGLRRLVEAEV
jgi:hypothetical protein